MANVRDTKRGGGKKKKGDGNIGYIRFRKGGWSGAKVITGNSLSVQIQDQ